MPEWLRVTLISVATLLVMAPRVLALWAATRFYTTRNLPDLPPAQVRALRSRSLLSHALRLAAFLCLGLALLLRALWSPSLAIIALVLFAVSMLFRPASQVIDERMRELSRQERAVRLARRIEKTTGRHD